MENQLRMRRVEPRIPGPVEIEESGLSGDSLGDHITRDARKFLFVGRDRLIVRPGNHRTIGSVLDQVGLSGFPMAPAFRAIAMYYCKQRIPFPDINLFPPRDLTWDGRRARIHKYPVGQLIVDLRQSARRGLHRYDQVLRKISIKIAYGEIRSAPFIDQRGSVEYTSDFGSHFDGLRRRKLARRRVRSGRDERSGFRRRSLLYERRLGFCAAGQKEPDDR